MSRFFAILSLLMLATPGVLRAEAMLQYFNTSWVEITAKMPELAEAGYSSLWLPPPTKGSGGLSVGYDLWDPYDLGGKNQRGSVRTRYGTEEELVRLVETAHRFGIRVYFDNIMNHNAFDVPGYNAGHARLMFIPGFVPEDFPSAHHCKTAFIESGIIPAILERMRGRCSNSALADLIDIAAQEPGTDQSSTIGTSEGSATIQKVNFLCGIQRSRRTTTATRMANTSASVASSTFCSMIRSVCRFCRPNGCSGQGCGRDLTSRPISAFYSRSMSSDLLQSRRSVAHGSHQGRRSAP